MKFSRCCWTYRNLKGWSPQRIAAARRAVAKEKEKVQARRDEVALFPEMQAEIQPRFTDEEERMAWADQNELWKTGLERQHALAMWRKARSAYYQITPHRRRGMRLLWNSMNSPKNPAYFAEFVRKFSTPGNSPWTHLRKVRLIWLWNHGGWPRPAHFRVITADFATLGPVTHPRILTQTFISLARYRGTTFRQVRKETLHRTAVKLSPYLTAS